MTHGASPLSVARATVLRSARYSYRPVGVTRDGGAVPAGFRRDQFRRTLARRDFDAAVEELLGWQLHLRAGIRVAASAPAAPGVVVEQRIGPGWASIIAPCRVVYLIDEPDRRGFAYGTLRGHPEAGEESFVLERTARGAIELTITAVSRPVWWLARLGAPVSRLVQLRVIGRYLAALDA